MSNVFPKSNLPVSSQPWGREIQKTVESLQEALARQNVNSGTSDAQLQASYRRIDETLNGLLGLGNADSPFSINADNINGGTITGVLFRSGTTGQRVEIESDNITFFGTAATAGASIFGADYIVFGPGGGEIVSGVVVQSAADIYLNAAVGNHVFIGGGLFVAEFLRLEPFVGGGTTGASINNAGTIIRTTSSEKYKQDIEPLEVNYEDLLSLEPKRFRFKDEAAADENARYYAGFIAEEIAQTSLTDFVAYKTNEDGTKEPDGVYYAELSTALLSALKQQDTLIKSLTARVEALENSDKV
jgi:hypothetical protein